MTWATWVLVQDGKIFWIWILLFFTIGIIYPLNVHWSRHQKGWLLNGVETERKKLFYAVSFYLLIFTFFFISLGLFFVSLSFLWHIQFLFLFLIKIVIFSTKDSSHILKKKSPESENLTNLNPIKSNLISLN